MNTTPHPKPQGVWPRLLMMVGSLATLIGIFGVLTIAGCLNRLLQKNIRAKTV